MWVKNGADIVTVNGDKVGSVDRVVLDPRTKEVTHVVVRKGVLLPEDKVLPIDLIEGESGDQLVLKEVIQDLSGLPNFLETEYVLVSEQDVAPTNISGYAYPMFWYPGYGTQVTGPSFGVSMMPPGAPGPLEAETAQNIPNNTVSLKEGAQVKGVDGEALGNLEQVLIDPQNNQATHFVIASGLLAKVRRLIPVQWVEHVGDKDVRLSVGKSTVEKLPPYEA